MAVKFLNRPAVLAGALAAIVRGSHSPSPCTGRGSRSRPIARASVAVELAHLDSALDPTQPSSAQRAAPASTQHDVLDLPVLVLNRHYVPIRVTPVRRALVLLYTGHARALEPTGELLAFDEWSTLLPRHEDDAVQLIRGALRAPRVVHLTFYDRVPRLAIRLTRQNLMLRDQYQCQYCGQRPGPAELNLDHVVPRSLGGTDSWENLVVSCKPCNLKKGKKTPREAGMHLRRLPVIPRLSHAALLLRGLEPPFEEWHPFLETG